MASFHKYSVFDKNIKTNGDLSGLQRMDMQSLKGRLKPDVHALTFLSYNEDET